MLMQKVLGIDFTMFGFGLPDDNLHSPNERCAAGAVAMLCQADRLCSAIGPGSPACCADWPLTMSHRFPLVQYETGISAYITLLGELGELGPSASQPVHDDL